MILTAFIALAAAQEPPTLRAELEPLGFLVGHCWRGTLPTGEQDRHCFEPVYGGQHVRDIHQVSGGSDSIYAGETFYSADGEGGLAFTYFNSIGGVSRGTMRPGAGELNFGEEHYRGADGRQIALSVVWQPLAGGQAYEVVTSSNDAPRMNGVVRYVREPEGAVSISETRAIDGSHVLSHEIIVPAAVEEVWAAIATPEGWRTWAVPVARSPEPDIIETSYSPGAEPGGPATIRQRILASIPGRMIAFRTVKAPDGFPDFDTFSRTTGLFELEPLGPERTRVRVTGAGYPDTEAGRRLLGFFRDGNKVSLGQLRERFVGGPIDWTEKLAASQP